MNRCFNAETREHFDFQESSRIAVLWSCGQYNHYGLLASLLIKKGICSDTQRFQSLTCQRHEVVVAIAVPESLILPRGILQESSHLFAIINYADPSVGLM